MNVNVDGYKLIFYLENLLREYVENYTSIDDLNDTYKLKLQEIADLNGEMELNNFHNLIKYSHIGELVDYIKSNKFKKMKNNDLGIVNIKTIIKNRNNVMHSRLINAEEMELILDTCEKIIDALKDNNILTKWNKFKVEDIKSYKIPSVHIEYPIGKNFDKLIGRNDELKTIKQDMKIPFPVSIVGHGGLGKTALVLQLIEDYVFSPDQPFEKIYFMSFKNTVFENGAIRRFEKVINNHTDLINKLAGCIGLDLNQEFNTLEEHVWKEIFNKKTLLILDNLETEIVKSNLSEFTAIAQRFISNFNGPSRLIITSRYGLGDREVKFPLKQFNLDKTKALIKNNLGESLLKEKQIQDEDWEWIQKYTRGNPGLIIAFSNTLRSTRKKTLDLRIEFNSQYTSESIELHNQLDEFLSFCFENTIESLNESSQIFLSIICNICSETNINEVNEEFLTYLRDELDLNQLGDENIRAIIFENIGFLQSVPNSSKYYINELYVDYMEGNYSENIFNVFSLQKSKWNTKVEKLKNHINELQFDEKISLGQLLSELYISKYKSTNNKKYLAQAFFCLPTIENLIKYYKRANENEILSNFSFLDKISSELKSKKEYENQIALLHLLLDALLQINKKIISKEITKIKQYDLFKYYQQMEIKIPILKEKNVNNPIRKLAIKLLINFKKYPLASEFLNNEEEIIIEKFNLLVKQIGDLSGKDSLKCEEYIEECKKILLNYPRSINKYLQAQFKLYSSRYVKKNKPTDALKLVENFEEYYISGNFNLYVFYIESQLVKMECLLRTKASIEEILTSKERYLKLIELPEYKNIFERKREGFDTHFKRIEKEISHLKQPSNI